VVFYTDGVTEVFNASADIFGETRLTKLLENNWQQGPVALLDQVRRAVSEFSASTLPDDDFTLLVLKRSQ
jgi:serine phosphatase RsbU (regulator of sigma subunit)